MIDLEIGFYLELVIWFLFVPYIYSLNRRGKPASHMTQPSESKKIWQVIAASSVGTLIEWYDFYIFGSLATVIASQFFPKTNPTAALIINTGHICCRVYCASVWRPGIWPAR
jgi:hypothetical protein